MKSRHCEACADWWPPFHFKCPVCGEPTKESSHAPMDETEYKWLLATKKGRFAAMPKSEQEAADAEWAALEAEVERRKGFWSLADLIAEGFRAAA